MKVYRLICVFWFCSMLSIGTRLVAQDTPTTPFQTSPVEISRVVDTILGKAYRVHTVQKGHTLYSICRAYLTSADSILKDSPNNQVQVDEPIYIPFCPQPNEKPQDLTRFTGKRPWAVVFLQKKESLQQPLPFESRKDESVDEDEKIKERQERKRRDRKNDPLDVKDTVILADTLLTEFVDSIFITPHPQLKENKDSLRISLLLPLYSNTPQDKKAYIYLPFFEGASVAWQEFLDPLFFLPPVNDTTVTQDSLMVEPPVEMPDTVAKPKILFKIYDLTQSANALDLIVNDEFFRLSDAVIATVFVDQFQMIDSLSKEWQMPIVHPLSERDSMGFANPYFVQLATSHTTQINHIADFVRKHHPHAQILIISDSSSSEACKAETLQNLLPGSEKLYFNSGTVSRLEELSESNQRTVIVPFYRKEITAVRTVLPLRQAKGNITIIAPNVWLDYATIDLDYYIQNNLTVYHSFCNAVQNTDFMEFSKNYYFLYHGLPNLLAYQGYKTLFWLLEMMRKYNADFMRHLEDVNETGIPEFYLFEEREIGGFENRDVHFVRVTESGLIHIR